MGRVAGLDLDVELGALGGHVQREAVVVKADDIAARIADASVANALKAGISERYDALTGAPLGVAGLGMSATVLTMVLDGLTSDAYRMSARKQSM